MKQCLIFKTEDTAGEIINSSAVLYTPIKPIGLIIVHHGTIFSNDMSPTKANMYDSIAKLFLEKNYAVVFPDYIGFGISFSTNYHPYLHKKTLAQNSFNMLQYIYSHKLIGKDCKIISTGYSEGGYASLAFVELAQNHGIMIDSINGAAPYNILNTLNKALIHPVYEFPEYISYIAYAYEKIYKLDGLVNNLFKGIYPNITHRAYEGRYQFEMMHRIYPKEIDRFVNTEFLLGDSEIMQLFKSKLDENSLSSFIPKSNTVLFSARADEIVDVNITLETFNTMKENNALNVRLIIDDNKNNSHFNSYPEFLKTILMITKNKQT